MGCASSKVPCNNGNLSLLTTKLNFTKDQLDRLNGFFRKIIEYESKSDVVANIEATVEQIVQRLVAIVGTLDRRFSSMFLVSLNEKWKVKQLQFKYLLRIDALSSPSVNSNEPVVTMEEDTNVPGYARLRLQAADIDTWSEFLSSNGMLRRDLIKTKLMNLLVVATTEEVNIDTHGKLCLYPGQIVDAEVLYKILKLPDYCKLFYGPADSEATLSDLKNYRIVLVEDDTGILMKIGITSVTSHDVEVKLLIGVSLSSWPVNADYPRRIPLYHCDTLLHYTASQNGMYVVATGIYPSTRCEDRDTLWQIRFPATETIMRQHYSVGSVPSLTESVLMEILDQLRVQKPLKIPVKRKKCLRLVSRYIIKTIHWWLLEQTGSDPLVNWGPNTLSYHILVALDGLVKALNCQNLRCYFYPQRNVMIQCIRDGVSYHPNMYNADSNIVESYIIALHTYSMNMPNYTLGSMDVMDNELIKRWKYLMTTLSRNAAESHYSVNKMQLQYIGLLLDKILKVKKLMYRNSTDHDWTICFSSSYTTEPVENLTYLLKLVLMQSKDVVEVSRIFQKPKLQHRCSLNPKRKDNFGIAFETSVNGLLNIVRADRDTHYADLESSLTMAKYLIKWLHFCLEFDEKMFYSKLRPYLINLSNSSWEYAWHYELWKKKKEMYTSEMRSLILFCKLVTTQEISPANGIVEFLSKGWNWAESVTKMIERYNKGLKLIFITPDKIIRCNLKFTNNKGLSSFSTWSKVRNISHIVKGNSVMEVNLITISDTVPQLRKYIAEDVSEGNVGHLLLRDTSPLTQTISLNHRRGRQRGPGGLIAALVTLNKFWLLYRKLRDRFKQEVRYRKDDFKIQCFCDTSRSEAYEFEILQEVTQVLPRDERLAMLDLIQHVAREMSRRLRRASCSNMSTCGSLKQTYTPRSESTVYDSPSLCRSKTQHKVHVVVQHKRQCQYDLPQSHNTLMRGLRSRSQLPAWDSTSIVSWTSSVGSVGRKRLRQKQASPWGTFRGAVTMRDIIGIDGHFVKSKSEEMISIEDSPKWNISNGGDLKDEKETSHPLGSFCEAS